MFDEMDKHFKQPKSSMQFDMVESLPIIYNAMHPSTTAIATETRAQLHSTKEEIIKMIHQNPSKINLQNPLINQILAKVKSITDRATKLAQKNKK